MELLKLLKDKKIILCFLLLLLAVAGIYSYQRVQTIHHKEFAYSLYDESVQQEILPYEEEQVAYAAGYQEGVAEIMQRADFMSGISIFQEADSFSSRNLEKTKEAYGRVASVQPETGDYEALEQMLSYDIGYSVFLFAFLLILYFQREEKNGLKKIFYATPGGRGRLAARQLGMMAGLILLYTISVYGVTWLASSIIYGQTGPLDVRAQSMMLLENFTYPVTIIEYLIVFVLLRALFATASAFFTWLILGVFRNRVSGFAVLVLVYVMEAVLFFSLTDTSAVAFLKYINLFGLVCPGDVLYTYRNFNFCSMPVNCFGAVILLAVVILAGSLLGILWIAEKRRPMYSSGKMEQTVGSMTGKVSSYLHRRLSRLSMTGFELYKLLIVNKGMIFILVWLIVIAGQLDFTRANFIGKSALLYEIYSEYAGSDDGRLREYVKEQEAVIREAECEYEQKEMKYEDGNLSEAAYTSAVQIYSSYSSLISAVNDIRKQLAYVDRMKEERRLTVSVVFEKPYRILWTGNGFYEGEGYSRQEILAVANLLLVIFLMAQIFAYDRTSSMHYVIRCCENGRKKIFHVRMAMVFVICLLVCSISYGLRLLAINRNYPVRTLGAPLQSLRFMENFPLEISIGGFMALVFVIHVLTLFAAALMELALVNHASAVRGMIAAVGILVVPQVAYMLGLGWGWYLSAVQPLVYVEILDRHGFGVSMAVTMLFLLAGILCGRRLHRKWCGDN